MKEMILILVIFIFSFTSVFAQKQLQKGENGMFRVKPDFVTSYEDADLTVSDCATDYIEYIPALLMMKEGDTLCVTYKTKRGFGGMISLFKYKENIIAMNGIAINNGFVGCVGPCVKSSEINNALFLIVILISIVIVTLFNLLFLKKKPIKPLSLKIIASIFWLMVVFNLFYLFDALDYFLTAAIFIDDVFMSAAAGVAVFFVSILIFIYAIFVLMGILKNNYKRYVITNIIFYGLLVLFFLLVFML